MTRSSKSRRGRRKKSGKTDQALRRDGAVYWSVLLIGVFVVALAFLLSEGAFVPHVAIGFVALLAVLINAFALRAFLGGRLMGWQQSLARVTLRPVGYGRKGGKPLTAAHGQPEVRNALIVSIVISLLVIAAGTILLLFPGLVGIE